MIKAFQILIVILTYSIDASHALAQQRLSHAKFVDKNTNKPISYCTITCSNDQTGGFSDSLGIIDIQNIINCDKILVTSLGYKSEVFNIKNNLQNDKDTLLFYLTPDTLKLEEVQIAKDATKIKLVKYNLGHFNSKKEVIDGTAAIGYTRALYIKNPTNNTSTKITKVLYSIHGHRNPIFDYQSAMVRINLFRKAEDSDAPGLPLINEDIIIRTKKGQGQIIYDVSKYNILLPKDGVFVAIQWLGELTSKIKPINISPALNSHRNVDGSIMHFKFLDKEWSQTRTYFNLRTKKEVPVWVPNFGISVIEYRN
jgi:hypothetical protein